MNDIDVKIVDSPKDRLVDSVESPLAENSGENEVDPLCIDEEMNSAKGPAVAVNNADIEKGAGNCDDNAKEENLAESEQKESYVEVKTEETKETPEAESNCTSDIKEDGSKTPDLEFQSEATDGEVKIDNKPLVEEKQKEIVEKEIERDVEMLEAPIDKTDKESKSNLSINGDILKEEPVKRRASEDVDTESPLKKLCQEVEKTFPQHDIMINDYIQTATKNNVDEIQRHTEQLLSEIQTLRELAQKKEHEWNNILHLKKVKEEILLRLLRRKQVLSFEKAADVNGSERCDPFDYLNQAKNLAIDKSDEISGLSLKPPGPANPMLQPPVMPVTTHFNLMSGLPPPYDKTAHMQPMSKPMFPQGLMMPGPLPGFPRDMNGQLPTSYGMPMGRQGPIKDVKSIIADYRQRNPDIAPRRGRRMKSIVNPNIMSPRPIAPKMDAINNMGNFNMLFNNLDSNQKAMLERLQQMQAGGMPNGLSFKDVLVQFANMQQPGMMPNRPMDLPRPEHIRPERRRPERNEEVHKQAERLASPSPRLPPPPPYPEISLLPVTTSQENSQQNSLLHGILTKNCGEITITPVQPTPPPAEPQTQEKSEVVQLDDEESPASEGEAVGSGGSGGSGDSPSGSGRLVIDEAAEDTPLCQGCRTRDAQFVCAGCANQWYCSRECQVAAWDEHSEMCSG
ncbi:unnamed protein product [Leptosia nina]|uniref:MYND-type domain-containing protein n=1 Tax=Leptosia nina TaxID=320188 RepID=A0AAV1JQ05_9NEOP